jgi:dephospho-CoA kinase
VQGLTGGIACGKSTVSRALIAKGIPIVDADKIAARVLDPGTGAYRVWPCYPSDDEQSLEPF